MLKIKKIIRVYFLVFHKLILFLGIFSFLFFTSLSLLKALNVESGLIFVKNNEIVNIISLTGDGISSDIFTGEINI